MCRKLNPAARRFLIHVLRGFLVVGAFLHLQAAGIVGEEIYRWRDADGVLHFTDTPPDEPADTAFSPEAVDAPRQTDNLPAKIDPAASGGVFWRIESSDRPSSYLLGTIHSADPRVATPQPFVLRAFENAAVLVMEMDLKADSFLSLGAAMMFTDGRDLERLLGPDDFRRVAAAVAQHGLPEQILRRMKPWAVLALISQPKTQHGAFLDMVLYQKAQAAGKPVVGLESAEEQVAVFDRMPMDDQLTMLRTASAQADQIAAMQNRMIETYMTGDLVAIAALADELAREDASGLNRRFIKRLNDERNDRMLARMVPHIDQGGAFIAVGALHLTGERGLLRQLRRRGYRLSPANGLAPREDAAQ